MKKKLMLLSAGLVVAVAGVATSMALLYGDANAKANGALDQGIVIEWGEGGLQDISNLTPGVPVNQSVTVNAPTKSASVAGDVTITFTLTDNSASKSLQVELSDEAWGQGVVADVTLSGETVDYTYTVPLEEFTTAKTYYVSYSLTSVGEQAEDGDVSGSLTVSVDFTEDVIA